jgi:hypothetical protein
MYPSIPVSEFVNPERGSSAFNAIQRAIEFNPEVVPIGTYEGERWYRVQSKGRQPHCVIVTDEEATCNCMAHHRPQSPLACLHIAQALIWESENKT